MPLPCNRFPLDLRASVEDDTLGRRERLAWRHGVGGDGRMLLIVAVDGGPMSLT